MPLIKHGQVVSEDTFRFVADDAEIPATGDVVVGLARFFAEEKQLTSREGRLGVRVDPEDEAAKVVPALAHVSLVALTFPKFSDGRAYSKARLFRERHGFRGEIRAVGEVLADQLQYMQRCGFDAFALAEGKDVAAALRALSDFTVTYQGAADDPRPLYRRTARGAS